MTSKRAKPNGRGEVVPHSVEAEQATLGSLLLDPDAWREIAGILAPDDFYRPDHRLIFEAIEVLTHTGRACDPITVAEQLEHTEHLEAVGGLAYLSTLARDTPTAANIRSYADIIRERSKLRHWIAFARSIESGIANGASAADLSQHMERVVARLKRARALDIETVSHWAERPEPAPRDWIVEGLIPAGRVSSFLGNGGLGKSTVSTTIAVQVACGHPVWSLSVSGGPVLGIFCEDERDEVERRVRAVAAAECVGLAQLDRLHLLPRDGKDNLLCTFDHEQIKLTDFYRETEATIEKVSPRLVIVDTAADVYAGDFMSTPQVRQFLKVALGGWCVRHGCGVLLLAHPSASGMNSGEGGGFSVAWSNSVRSRLYLRRPDSDDKEAAKDRRVLEVKKANYASDGLAIPLIWQAGCFVRDPEPLEEQIHQVKRAPKTDTKLALATLEVFREKAGNGTVLAFGTVFKALRDRGLANTGDYDTDRKPVQRTLKQLVDEHLIAAVEVPRGCYRLPVETQA